MKKNIKMDIFMGHQVEIRDCWESMYRNVKNGTWPLSTDHSHGLWLILFVIKKLRNAYHAALTIPCFTSARSFYSSMVRMKTCQCYLVARAHGSKHSS